MKKQNDSPIQPREIRPVYTEAEKEAFRKFADRHAPKRRLFEDCLWAFFVGGSICAVGEGLSMLFSRFIDDPEVIGSLTSASLILLSCLLTGIGWYDTIASKAGAGTLVPITGFANAVCAPAIDGRAEGLILGVASSMFTIAGPVLVYGTVASTVWGFLYYFFFR